MFYLRLLVRDASSNPPGKRTRFSPSFMYYLKSFGLHGEIPNHLIKIPTNGIFLEALEPNNLQFEKKSCVIHPY